MERPGSIPLGAPRRSTGSGGDTNGAFLADGKTRQATESLARGQRLSGPHSRRLIGVVDGLVALCTSLHDGRRQIVYLSGANEVLFPCAGQQGLEYWVEAIAPSRLSFFKRCDGADVCDGAQLNEELLELLLRQNAAVNLHIVTLGRLDGMERVCLFLADMAWRFGNETAGGWLVQLPLSREDMADYLGLNSETVSRILGRVKKSKLVVFLSRSEYLVKDMDVLQKRVPLRSCFAPAAKGPHNGEERHSWLR